ncbi:MAG: hypothetical protein R3F49_22545 [Planctomycetota bacterium]
MRIWLASLALGCAALAAHGASGAAVPLAPARLPAEVSAALDRHRDAPEGARAGAPLGLIVLHPKCPCSLVELDQLATLAGPTTPKVRWLALFVVPPGAPDGFAEGALWDRVQARDDIEAVIDRDGVLARALGAERSGTLALYDSAGALRFQGGLTEARGHAGPSRGLTLLHAALNELEPAGIGADTASRSCTTTSARGCALFTSPTASTP